MVEVRLSEWTERLLRGDNLNAAEAQALAGCDDLPTLLQAGGSLRDAGFGSCITVSRKVFIPLTQLCRDVCHYCTFAHAPMRNKKAFLSREEVLAIARAGAELGCNEALFTLGDKPELRYAVAREELAAMGYASTLDYLHDMAEAVVKETGLLPHINAGVMGEADIARLRGVSASQGLMLESTSERLGQRGGAHFGSPDKQPARRLDMIAAAGRARVPFTSGVLVGIGETRAERIDALLLLRALHREYGHIQEIIIQNFRAKPGTRMAGADEPSLQDQQWTIAVARLIFGPTMSIQAPPNLRAGELEALLAAGINDWGGVSPVTPDHVNPEAPWPALHQLADETALTGKTLVPRLTVYPQYLREADGWLDAKMRPALLRHADGAGYAQETLWRVGRKAGSEDRLVSRHVVRPVERSLNAVLDKAVAGRRLEEAEIVRLFMARGPEEIAVCAAADGLRKEKRGDTVTYVVNRNINYTNVCGYRCQFCAFSKGKTAEHLRGKPYDLDLPEIIRRAREAWDRGATEVCMQGGIHPDYSGKTYLAICRAVKEALPAIHVHAFSPLEVSQGARSLGIPLEQFLRRLKDAGLGTLPGTAAEILDDEVRNQLCADKLTTDQWLEVIETAHRVGFRTTATIMYGHVDAYEHWARHLLRLRALQERTGGFTEFVPLPFVHMEAPIYMKGQARQGPSYRESVLMHAVARLVFSGLIDNIQVSWVKMGDEGVAAALQAGANDLGGTLMNESISRAAGTQHGQEMSPERMVALIRGLGRIPRQRTTVYGDIDFQHQQRAFGAAPLSPVIEQVAGRRARIGSAMGLEAAE